VSARLFPGIDRCAFKASVGRLIEIDMSSGVANECSFSSTESQTKDCCIDNENRKEREEERERKIQEEEERDPGRCRERQPRTSFWIYREPNRVIHMSPRIFCLL
jgi:hypothetical protein